MRSKPVDCKIQVSRNSGNSKHMVRVVLLTGKIIVVGLGFFSGSGNVEKTGQDPSRIEIVIRTDVENISIGLHQGKFIMVDIGNFQPGGNVEK